MLVSGVRSSCEASATNSRWAWTSCWASVREASSSREHRIERPSQLGDLVVGRRLRHRERRVARRRDFARGRGQRRDRPHRPLRHPQAGERRQQCSGADSDAEEQPKPADRGVELVVVARIEHVDGVERARRRGQDALRDREVSKVRVRRSADWGGGEDSSGATSERPAESTIAIVASLARIRSSNSERPMTSFVAGFDLDRERELTGGRLELLAEVVLESILGEPADDRGERQQDREGQGGRDAGEAPADGPARRREHERAAALRHRLCPRARCASRSRLRVSCGADAARRPPRACAAGSR